MEENENVVEETTPQEEVTKVEVPSFDSADDDSVIKVNLDQPPVVETEEPTEELKEVEQVEQVEQIEQEPTIEETPVLQEVTNEVEEAVEQVAEEIGAAIEESNETGQALPENIQKVVDFVNDTGGSLEDYVNLNKDYNEMDNLTALQEYYKMTKPHLDADERDFLMDETFSIDEDIDDEKEIRRKKIALKEQVAEAKAYLDGQKSKYYEEIKGGSKLPDEAKKAMDFFNRYNKESEQNAKIAEQQKSTFLKKTNTVFNDKFKGFEYNVGDKKYRFNVKNAEEVKTTQSDINNFVKKFLNEDNTMSDAEGYHKSLYTAMNADAIAKHFYEQGQADALRESVTKSKNVNMEPRQSHGEIEAGGIKVRALGENSSDFKFKIKSKRK
jgi:hypothetical protein